MRTKRRIVKRRAAKHRLAEGDITALCEQRRKRFLKQIKGESAVFVSAPPRVASHDQFYPYRMDSHFYYLTGIAEPSCALVLRTSSTGPRSILFLRDRDAVAERWTGERLGLRRARRACPVDEVRDIKNFESDLPALLAGSSALHYSPGIDSRTDQYIWSFYQSPTGPRPGMPPILKDARIILNEMRFVKDRHELRLLQHAADITANAFVQLFCNLKLVKSELHGARLLESYFAQFGASHIAFPTIVASGKNATFLHHEPKLQPLWREQLVLIDAGAMYRGYAADITRTVPVNGKFSPEQAVVYDIVLHGAEAGLKKAKPGSTLDEIHEAVARGITEGLVDARILKGNADTLFQTGKYRQYFMHRSGHWLGLDTHDVAPVLNAESGALESSYKRPLVSGNVFTHEPGLYFDADDESVPKRFRGIGIRIEDDVVITDSGSTILTASLPRSRDALQELLR